ncbi:hypothetical protein [Brevifollis gellanilyticus]|uniref:Uncharacterized protein n=1 Tax=Brevifollis gellanilyticus TaxID=748831 RepID=A0A512ME74_9BACT|nr:hypothetical protein [Brevifollis gellanilyticus]GEP45037.1 hypothetical protein BGE01nite_43280 [Brevifollis gellanilyticus]
MSVAELKKEVSQLALADRIELADFLARKDRGSRQARQARISRRMKSLDRGRKFTAEDLMAVHKALKSIGL